MVTDFSEYTGQRSITFNGKNSLSDFGVLMHKATEYPTVKPRIVQENIPFHDGSIDFSTIGGKYNFENRELSIVFLILAETNAEAMEKISALNNWLFAVTDKKLYDSDIEGYCFTNVICIETYTEALIKGGIPVIGYRAKFTADPYMESTDGVRQQIITLAGRVINAYILNNSVLCTGYAYPEQSTMSKTIIGTDITMTLNIDSSYAGLRCFDIDGTVDVELTGGDIDGTPITLTGTENGYFTVPAAGGTLTLTGTVPEGTSASAYIIIALAAGIAFQHDSDKKYRIDDYAVGTHTLTVNGIEKPFDGFTIGGTYDTLSIVGARQTDVYKLWYDSVEVSL